MFVNNPSLYSFLRISTRCSSISSSSNNNNNNNKMDIRSTIVS